MPDDSAQLELRYHGADVENGTVPVSYMVDALVGFSGAYGKLSRRRSLDFAHQIRVVGLEPGSARILVDVLEFVKANPAAATVIAGIATAGVGGAYKVVKDLAAVIGAKKHLAGAPLQPVTAFLGPTIAIFNQSGQPLELTREQYEFLQSGEVDAELDKLTAPLEEGRVDQFELNVANEPLVTVDAKERPFFVHTEVSVTSSKDNIWMEGTLNSLSKTGFRGMFHTVAGKHIPYRFVGDDQQSVLDAFAFQGIVRVNCKVSFDSDVNPTYMEIYTVEVQQGRLFNNQ